MRNQAKTAKAQAQAEGLLDSSRGQAQRRPRMVPAQYSPTLKGSSILCGRVAHLLFGGGGGDDPRG